nr:histidine phosphatase family protein [uncultured Desulfobulbus sp.]
MKRLIICRHAKSSWSDPELRDFDRPLNKRGIRDAPLMGKRLAAQGIKPDLICSSPAERARETARQYSQQLAYPYEQIVFDAQQYEASVAQLLTLIHNVDSRIKTLMMVGHNPECTALVNFLSGLQIDNIPTCGIVGLEFAGQTWKEICAESGTLLFFDYPKKVAS